MSPIISAKAQTFAKALDSARRAALWNYKSPVTAKGDSLVAKDGEVGALTWEELVNKFARHNPDRSVTAEAARVDRTIHTLLSAASTAHEAGESYWRDDPERGRVAMAPLIPERDRGAAEQALNRVREVVQEGEGTGSNSDRNSARIVMGFAHYALGGFSACLSTLLSCNLDPLKFDAQSKTEAYDLILLVMGTTLQGLAHERSNSLPDALRSYGEAARAYGICTALLQNGDGKNEELHGWGEEAMYRLALLSRTHSDEAMALEAHRSYHYHLRDWPSFRFSRRCSLYRSYLRLLFISARHRTFRPDPNRASTDSSEPHSASTLRSFSALQAEAAAPFSSAAWRGEVLSVQRAYEFVLRQALRFPKSGYINVQLLELCDLCVEAWTLAGRRVEDAEAVVEMLYRATTLTFQSQKIMRHLVDLLHALGQYEEAGEALRLYIQLFTKAKETGAGEVHQDSVVNCKQENGDREEGLETSDFDTDEQFAETLVLGVRLLVKHLQDPDTASEAAELAAKVLDQDRTKPKSKLRARVEAIRGVARGAQAAQADRETRAPHQKACLEHLLYATELDPASSEAHYHLAYAQAEMRQVSAALASARRAAELNPARREAWHLVALMVTAQRDLQMALNVIDAGLAMGSMEGEEDDAESPNTAEQGTSANGVPNGNRAIKPSRGGESTSSDGSDGDKDDHQTLLGGEDLLTPRPRNFSELGRAPDPMSSTISTAVSNGDGNIGADLGTRPGPGLGQDEAGELEAVVQLRMTRNVVIEAIEGTEVAMQDQRALFEYFSQIEPLMKDRDSTKPKVERAPELITEEVTTPSRPRIREAVRSARRASVSRRANVSSIFHRRTASVSSKASRVSTTPVHIAPARFSIAEETEKDPGVKARSNLLLQSLWLMSAATFRRWGRAEECKGSIQEAESLDSDNPEVWVQYALHCLATGDLSTAIDSLTKSLALNQDHIPAVVHLARIFLDEGSVELAEGLLDALTQTSGWDVPEAWFLLGQVLERTRRHERSRDCLLYALQLEETKPLRPLSSAVPRCL